MLETAIDIMLVGNKGVIYHETPVGRHYLNATSPQLGATGELTEAIAQSLESGQPITFGGLNMQRDGKYGVLLLGGNRTHQENYALSFAQDARCRLVAFADEPDAPPERITLARSLAESMDLPFIPDLDTLHLHARMCIS